LQMRGACRLVRISMTRSFSMNNQKFVMGVLEIPLDQLLE
jgi:hypothetical protein